MTRGFLSQNGVRFTEINVLTDLAALATVCQHLAAPPLVVVGDQAVSGYRLKRLRELLELP